MLKPYEDHQKKQFLLLAGVVLLIALVLRLGFIALFETDLSAGDAKYFLEIAQSIRAGEGFREGHLLAYRPPAFPAFVAAVQYVLGDGLTGVRIAQAGLGALTCVLIFSIGRQLGGWVVGASAAVFSAVYPPMIFYSTEILSEMLFLAFLLSAIYCLLRSRWQARLRWSVFAGVFFGLATLAREVGLVVMLATLLWHVLDAGSIRTGIKKWGIVAIATLTVVAPWTARNYSVFDTLVPVTTNGGINFYMGNNADATGEFRWALPPGAVWNSPSPNGKFETETNSLGYAFGLEHIKSDLRGFLDLSLTRAWLMLRPPIDKLAAGASLPELVYRLVWLVMHSAILAMAVVAAPVLLLNKKTRGEATLLYISFLSLIAPHVVSVAGSRYQFPSTPVLVLLAAMVLAWCAERSRSEKQRPQTKDMLPYARQMG